MRYKDLYYIICQPAPHYWRCCTASMPTPSCTAREPLLASLNWLESILQRPKARKYAGLKQTVSHPTIQTYTDRLHPPAQVCFIKTRGSWLVRSVTGAGKWQHGAEPWWLSKGGLKAQAAWAVESGRKCTFLQMKDGQECSVLVMATGAAPSQPCIPSRSHLLDRGSLTQSLRVPEEPADSSSTGLLSSASNRCHRLSLWVWLLRITQGTSASACSSILFKKHECFEGAGKLADKKLCHQQGCVWTLNMSQSTFSETWWCWTTNAPKEQCTFDCKWYYYTNCLSNLVQGRT